MTASALPGRLLVASPDLDDPNFSRAVVVLLEHGERGALGVVLNRPSELGVGEVAPAWADRVNHPPVLFEGGPVQHGLAIALGTVPAHIEVSEAWSRLEGGLATIDLAADPARVPELGAMRVYVGYAGWGPGQLELEIDAGAWFVVDAVESDVFGPEPGALWRAVLRRQPSRLRLLATYPDDPAAN